PAIPCTTLLTSLSHCSPAIPVALIINTDAVTAIPSLILLIPFPDPTVFGRPDLATLDARSGRVADQAPPCLAQALGGIGDVGALQSSGSPSCCRPQHLHVH